MLTSEERRQIIGALDGWAHSVPDEPLFGFLENGRLLTPSQLVAAVVENTPEGQALLEMLEHGVHREGIQTVVARIERKKAVLGG